MLAADLRAKIDGLWDKFWAGGLANPLVAIDQINYLIFLKQLEDTANLDASRARAQGEEPETIFDDAEDCRWSYWKNLKADEMFAHVQNRVFPWMKDLALENVAFTEFMRDAVFLIPKPSLLVEAVNVIDDLAISDRNVDTQGDIFEYMLSKLNVAGQIGQFRTPRHVIRAMTEIIDPAIGETVVDPACGTGGFLIAAAQHMIALGTSPDLLEHDEHGVPKNLVGDRLTAAQWEWLRGEGLIGFDFDPSMVRIAAMNMVLHGISRPRVSYADTLGPRFPHQSIGQIVLANPPFSGSVDENDISDDFRIKSKKTELLFLQLFLDVLNEGGRAAVIVPEGVLMGGDRASHRLKETLLDRNTLKAVISLPHSTFKPYASVSTAILVFQKGGNSDRVWMYRVFEDGFSQNAAREPIDANDLPDLIEQWRKREDGDYAPVQGKHAWVSREDIANRDDELAPRVYLQATTISHDFDVVPIAELCTLQKGSVAASKATPGDYPLVTTAENLGTSDQYDFEGEAVCVPLVSSTGHGHASIKRLFYMRGRFAAATIVAVLQPRDDAIILPRFLFYYLTAYKEELLVSLMKGAANVSLSLTKIGKIEVAVPSVEEQLAFIAELDSVEERRQALVQDLVDTREQQVEALADFKRRFTDDSIEEAA